MRRLKLLLLILLVFVGCADTGRSSSPDAYAEAKDQYAVGRIYYYGAHGIQQDYRAAALQMRKAADQGLADAQYGLGLMYYEGHGMPQDFAMAASWWRKAAEQGHAAAQYGLVLMYERGQGVPRDNAAAASPNAPPGTSSPITPTPSAASSSSIAMKKSGGTYVVPVLINNAITLDFTVDSGASDVSIPLDVVTTLIRAGTIQKEDITGEQVYTLADGSKIKSYTFQIRSLKVGDRVLENVRGSVASTSGSLLLGQSFLGRFKSWSIDNSRHALVLE